MWLFPCRALKRTKMDFLRKFNFNYIFFQPSRSGSFSLTVSWILGNTADESGCRGVLITHKLLSADRQSNFSIIKPLPVWTKPAFPFTDNAISCGITYSEEKHKKRMKNEKKKKTNPRVLKGFPFYLYSAANTEGLRNFLISTIAH